MFTFIKQLFCFHYENMTYLYEDEDNPENVGWWCNQCNKKVS